GRHLRRRGGHRKGMSGPGYGQALPHNRDPRIGWLCMSEPSLPPRALVEHFFRHEFGRLVAVLTRSLGVRRLALLEDVVQGALVEEKRAAAPIKWHRMRD